VEERASEGREGKRMEGKDRLCFTQTNETTKIAIIERCGLTSSPQENFILSWN